MSSPNQYYSLLDLQTLLRDLVAACPMAQKVWIVAELSDVRENGGHCYMELLQKDASGTTLAKARATIWANLWRKIRFEFLSKTGQQFASGMKVKVCVSAGYHPLYGMNLNISDVDYTFTLGERERRRREILNRLISEGIADANKQLSLPRPTQRIAVISSPTAAGYGDFMNQLLNNPRRLRFSVELFPAVVQGAQTAASVISRLEEIAKRADDFDCVCIIRGGGAATDLDGFDDLRLASNVALFPLPVIVGIGHERDTTVLDYIACCRVKTPTAAAELLLNLGQKELETLMALGGALLQTATDAISGADRQLAYISGALPTAPHGVIERANRRLDNLAGALSRVSATRIMPLQSRLERLADALKATSLNATAQAATRLKGYAALIDALSPKATLARGFSITRVNGAALTSATNLPAGSVIETELADGTITSITQ